MGISPGATHNLKVVGSNPTPAPKQAPEKLRFFGGFLISVCRATCLSLSARQLANQEVDRRFDLVEPVLGLIVEQIDPGIRIARDREVCI